MRIPGASGWFFRFSYPLETEAWVLQGWSDGSLGPLPEFRMIARLRPGVSVAHAQAELATLLRIHGVGRDFFDTVGIPLVAGRLFGVEDERFGPPYVGIVSRRCARRLSISEEAAAGTRLRVGDDEIPLIGVVGRAL